MSTAEIMQPPRTMMEVFNNIPEGTFVQLIENQIIMSPAPSDTHQKILIDVLLLLADFVRQHQLGEIRIAPYDVYFDRKNAFQPDIIFVSKERLHLIQENGLHGAPDLVIELLSPATAKYDLEEKKNVYERNGVKEYWIVEPNTRSVQGFQLVNNIFEALPTTKGIIQSALLKNEFKF